MRTLLEGFGRDEATRQTAKLKPESPIGRRDARLPLEPSKGQKTRRPPPGSRRAPAIPNVRSRGRSAARSVRLRRDKPPPPAVRDRRANTPERRCARNRRT